MHRRTSPAGWSASKRGLWLALYNYIDKYTLGASLQSNRDLMSSDKIFEALASAPRRRILAYLSKTNMTAGEIVQRFVGMMTQPAISKHLSVLENAGLVRREKRGQNMHYELNEGTLAGSLVHFLAEVCPRSRPFRRESAEAARRKSAGKPKDKR
jgi:ArsR family transcriptional regulator, arsenate/arsenite/antimonite-responsive transcriptional repressor